MWAILGGQRLLPLPGEFAYESDLRDFLAKNLSLLEPGLRLYQDEGITGVEFPACGRFIDILAVDTRENLVVIELKVSRGYDRVFLKFALPERVTLRRCPSAFFSQHPPQVFAPQLSDVDEAVRLPLVWTTPKLARGPAKRAG